MSGDKEALARLRDAVGVGWYEYSTNHDMIVESRGGTITELCDDVYGYGPGYRATLDRPVTNQGRRYTTSWLKWPVEDDDFEVQERDRFGRPVLILHLYRMSYGRRVRSVSIEFTPPTRDR